jgi:hypothetical protein
MLQPDVTGNGTANEIVAMAKRLASCTNTASNGTHRIMKRLFALLMLVAFAWSGFATVCHAATSCNDLGQIATSTSDDGSHPSPAASDDDVHHCAPVCHSGAALPIGTLPLHLIEAAIERAPVSVVGSTGHILAIPTPPPSLV